MAASVRVANGARRARHVARSTGQGGRRITLCVAVGIAAMVVAAPAVAHTGPGTTHEVHATPCLLVCASWLEPPFEPCERPFPPGSYVDLIRSAPAAPDGKVTVLEATMDAQVDWDLFLCGGDPMTTLARAANILGDPCDNPRGNNSLVPMGCHEDASVALRAGEQVIVRAYNVADPGPARIGSWFLFI